MKENLTFKYNAFISYSHKDKETIEWLKDILVKFWVPRYKQRSIHLDRDSLLSGGGLNTAIKKNLKSSEFLIVCCSENAIGSPWVDKEIKYFLEEHPIQHVLACRVGPPSDDFHLPEGIRKIQEQLGEALLLPDLTGVPSQWDTSQKKIKQREALTLLATILKLPGKDAILDRRKKRRIIISALVSIFIAWVVTGLLVYQTWLKTPEGRTYTLINEVLRTAPNNRSDQQEGVYTIQALANLRGKKAVDQFALAYDQALRPGMLLGGYAVLDNQNETIESIWANAEYPSYFKTFSVGPLQAARALERTDWLTDIVQIDQLEPDSYPKWAELFAKSGWCNQSLDLLNKDSFPSVSKLETALYLQIHCDVETIDDGVIYNALKQQTDAHDSLLYLVDFLELLFDYDQLDSKIGQKLLKKSLEAAEIMVPNISYTNTWNICQRLAALLGSTERFKETHWLLSLENDGPTFDVSPYWTTGWAWRAVAYQYLGQPEESQQAIATAKACAETYVPASRSWSEYDDLLKCYTLLGDWRMAYSITDDPPAEWAQFNLKCKALEYWMKEKMLN